MFQQRGETAVVILDAWLSWARRSQIAAFVELWHRIKKHRHGIITAVTHGLSNRSTESVNTKLRLTTRIAYGFRSTDNLIALCLLDRGGYCPPCPAGAPPHDPRKRQESHFSYAPSVALASVRGQHVFH